MAQGKTHTEADIPFEAINEASKTFEMCDVRVLRRGANGKIASIINSLHMRTLELLSIDSYLDDFTGGGNYTVQARNPSGTEPLYVVNPFQVNIEGAPRPRPANGQVVAPMPSLPTPAMFSPQPQGPDMSQNPFVQYTQSLYPQQPTAQPTFSAPAAPSSRWSSDQIAVAQIAAMKEDLGRMLAENKSKDEKREADARRHEERMAELKAQHDRELGEERRRREEADRQRENDRRAEERAALAAQMQQMQMNFQQQIMQLQQAPKGPSIAESIGPLLTAYMSNSQSRDSTAINMQMKMMEMQQASSQQTMQMMMKLGSGDKEYIGLFKEMLAQKSPESAAMMINSMLEMQITTAGALANLVKETMPEDPPMWMQAVMSGLGTAQGLAREMFENNRAKQQQQHVPQHQQLAPGPQAQVLAPPPPAAQGPGLQTMVLDEATGQPILEESEHEGGSATDNIDEETYARVAQQVDQMAAILPLDFRTQEWRTILIELHAEADPEHAADLLTRHLSHLMVFRGLPDALKEFPNRPRAVLSEILSFLPIGQSNPEYAREVIELTVAFLAQEGHIKLEGVEPTPAEARSNGNGTLRNASGLHVVPAPQAGPEDVHV